MRCPIICACLLTAAVAGLTGCGPSEAERAQAEARIAAERQAEARTEALRGLRELEAAVADAREAVRTAAEVASPDRARALHLSDMRRAIVVANVAVQKAREAISREDYPAVVQAVSGQAGRLRDVVSGKPGAEAGPGSPGRR